MPKKPKKRCFNCAYSNLEIKKKQNYSWEKCHECESQVFNQHKDKTSICIRLAFDFSELKKKYHLDYHEIEDGQFTKCKAFSAMPKEGISLDFKEIVDCFLSQKSLPENYQIKEVL